MASLVLDPGLKAAPISSRTDSIRTRRLRRQLFHLLQPSRPLIRWPLVGLARLRAALRDPGLPLSQIAPRSHLKIITMCSKDSSQVAGSIRIPQWVERTGSQWATRTRPAITAAKEPARTTSKSTAAYKWSNKATIHPSSWTSTRCCISMPMRTPEQPEV